MQPKTHTVTLKLSEPEYQRLIKLQEKYKDLRGNQLTKSEIIRLAIDNLYTTKWQFKYSKIWKITTIYYRQPSRKNYYS